MPDEYFAHQRYALPTGYIPNSKTWVCTINTKVVGFVSLIGSEVAALFVDPDYHGLGVGRSLLDTVKPLCAQMKLEVFEANTKGLAFYKAYGFRVTASRPYKDSGQKLLVLTMDVTPS